VNLRQAKRLIVEYEKKIDELTRALHLLEQLQMHPAAARALHALHVWLHHPTGDMDLTEEAEDFHERMSDSECIRALEVVLESQMSPNDRRWVVGELEEKRAEWATRK
jgi:hypothetical protein